LTQGPSYGSSYSVLQRRLHWLVALMVLLQFALQGPMRNAMAVLEQELSLTAMGFLVTTVHTLSGSAIGIVLLWRLHLRKKRPVKTALAALWVHRLMYFLLLMMVVSGTLNYYFGIETARRWHELGKWGVLGLLFLHAMAALWHHFIAKDTVLQRMLGIGSHTDTMVD